MRMMQMDYDWITSKKPEDPDEDSDPRQGV
jgi:hypothetical protein